MIFPLSYRLKIFYLVCENLLREMNVPRVGIILKTSKKERKFMSYCVCRPCTELAVLKVAPFQRWIILRIFKSEMKLTEYQQDSTSRQKKFYVKSTHFWTES